MLILSSLLVAMNFMTAAQPLSPAQDAASTPPATQPAPAAPAPAPNDGDPAPGVSVTVYSSADPAGFDVQQFVAQQRSGNNPGFAWQVPGFGVVKEVRKVTIEPEQTTLRFTDVAAFIDPTTVSFLDLNDPTTSVLEQNFEFDLVSPEKLLDRFIDRAVRLTRFNGEARDDTIGVLLAANGGQLVVQVGDSIRMIPQQGTQVVLDALPGGLITRPTLVWKLANATPGEHLIRTTYQTSGITWKADYNLVLSDDERSADLAAWVTLLNLSGAGYPDASLKLIAGDVQRVQPQPPPGRMYRGAPMEMALAADAGFEEKSFFEYHLYTLPRRTDILANSSQQITLFPTARGVPVEKVLVLDSLSGYSGLGWGNEPYFDRGMGATAAGRFDVMIRFTNSEASGLGRPLPRGKIRVYKQDDADGTLEFIGEDLIDHTPRNEKVKIRVGRAFDLVAERTQVDFSLDTARRTMSETIRINLRNRKDVAQTVLVREQLFRWSTSEVVRATPEAKRVDARTLEWEMELPADGSSVIEYTVRYTW